MTITEACKPRQDILSGTFNPEIFTASLSQVIDFYRTGHSALHNIYTDAETFFSKATYGTDGLKMTLFEVCARLMGETTSPTLPIRAVEAGIDTACRMADGIRVARNRLFVNRVKVRLKNKIIT